MRTRRLAQLVVAGAVAAALIAAPGVATAATPEQLNEPLPAFGDVTAFEISEDGATVVYKADGTTDEVFALFSVPIGGGTPVRLAADIDSFAISPDATTVVYDVFGGSTPGVFSVSIAGGPAVQLHDDDASFAISPDSSTVVMADFTELLSVPIGGGPAVRLDLFDSTDFQISANSAQVVYRTAGAELRSVPIGGGAPVVIAPTAGGYALTPDGRSVVYTDGGGGLFVEPAGGGTPVRLSPSTGRVHSDFQITPDGSAVAFRLAEDDKEAVWGAYLSKGGAVQLAPTTRELAKGDGYAFDITPDSTAVVSHFDGDLHVGSFASGHLRQLASDVLAPVAAGPDSAHAFYLKTDFELYSVPLAGGAETPVSSPVDVRGFEFSPGGERLYFPTPDEKELYRVPIPGGAPEKIDDGFGLEVSPTGAHVVYFKPGSTNLFSWADPGGADAPGGPPPPPPGAPTVGMFDPGQGRWHLRDEAGDVTSFFYGNPGDTPVMGDWDCDGVDTPGLFRTSDAFAYLRNSNTQGIADIRFFFGDPSDVPLAGDWDGDGCDTLSIYRPSEQRFYIVNELGEDGGGLGEADFSFLFGNPGDKPVVGDWDRDGVDEVGLHRESTGFFYWRDTLDTGIADGEIFFGDPGDRFVAGDWGFVDGVDTPAVFRPSAETVFFRYTLTQGIADTSLDFGEASWLPLAGHFGL